MSKKKKNKRQMQYRSDIERVSTEARKVNKNVYRLIAVSVEEETSKKGITKTSMKNRTVAYFNQGASLDLIKPLLATVRARYLFDRWQDKPSDKRRNKVVKAYRKARKLLGGYLQGKMPPVGSYANSVVNLCLDMLDPILSIGTIVRTTGPGEAGSADYSQQVSPPAEVFVSYAKLKRIDPGLLDRVLTIPHEDKGDTMAFSVSTLTHPNVGGCGPVEMAILRQCQAHGTEEAPKAEVGPFGASYVVEAAAEASPSAPADLSSTADPPIPSP